MITRSRIFITAAWVCHLLLAPGIVTSQTPPPAAAAIFLTDGASSVGLPPENATSDDLPSVPIAQTEEPVTIRAVQQEKDGPIYHLRGAVEIHYRTYVLSADQVTYHSDTGDSE